MSDDPVRSYHDALPAQLRAQFHETQRAAAFIHAATARGWTTKLLVAETTRDLAGVYKPGGVMTSRLEHCSKHDPPVKRPKQRPEWCGDCDPTTRQTLDENQLPSGRRCLKCHPMILRRVQ